MNQKLKRTLLFIVDYIAELMPLMVFVAFALYYVL